MLQRSVNTGFSGGEKKRNEILQMAVLDPRLAILDETDSGLDIDALRIVADGVNAMRRPDNATIVVTHYQRLLNYIVPDFVHVLADGRIVRSGGKELALELEAKGYDWVTEATAAWEAGAAAARLGADRAAGTMTSRVRCVGMQLRRATYPGIRRRARSRERRQLARHDSPVRVRAIPGVRLPDDEERGLALHERRADRRGGVPAARGARRRREARRTSRRSRSARPTGRRSCSSTACSRRRCRRSTGCLTA